METPSSKSFKENIFPIDTEIDTSLIYQLIPVGYNLRLTPHKREVGLIAEDVDEILPIIVLKDEGGQPRAIYYDRLSVILVEEMKKLKRRIEKLEDKLASL